MSYVYDDILDLLKLNKYKFIEGFETEEELFDSCKTIIGEAITSGNFYVY